MSSGTVDVVQAVCLGDVDVLVGSDQPIDAVGTVGALTDGDARRPRSTSERRRGTVGDRTHAVAGNQPVIGVVEHLRQVLAVDAARASIPRAGRLLAQQIGQAATGRPCRGTHVQVADKRLHRPRHLARTEVEILRHRASTARDLVDVAAGADVQVAAIVARTTGVVRRPGERDAVHLRARHDQPWVATVHVGAVSVGAGDEPPTVERAQVERVQRQRLRGVVRLIRGELGNVRL